MYESISKNNELENEMTLDMSYFWYSDVIGYQGGLVEVGAIHIHLPGARICKNVGRCGQAERVRELRSEKVSS